MGRRLRKQQERLRARQRQHPAREPGHRRPGSMNRHKSISTKRTR